MCLRGTRSLLKKSMLLYYGPQVSLFLIHADLHLCSEINGWWLEELEIRTKNVLSLESVHL